ncbi:MAG TPA: methyltransferase, TIGR04325 family [Bacteroidia bacterium]|nr:methyltransferase, TIGR04325 family [Bacteroidia bacterium]
MPCAAIVLFCYKRPWHTRQCLQSLARNKLAAQSDLYIYQDGLPENASENDKALHREVKDLLSEQQWCARMHIRGHRNNKGLAASVTDGVSEVLDRHDTIIVLEDDLVCDLHFLDFMNQALDLYKLDEKVACISAYVYPVRGQLPRSFFLKGADCWGWATWKRAWEIFEPDGRILLQQIETQGKSHEFDFSGTYPYTQMLRDQIEGKNNSWAVRWYASAFLKNMLCLYPGQALIQNIGNDGSGTHAGESSAFAVKLLNQDISLNKVPLVEDLQAKSLISEFFRSLRPERSSLTTRLYRKFVPQVIRNMLYKIRHPEVNRAPLWTGDYSSWAEVQAECEGYDSDAIFQKVKNAALSVKAGEALFERDSVLFYQIDHHPDFLAILNQIAEGSGGHLNVLDFGGSLGSLYFQYKAVFSKFKSVRWNVVEQKHFVDFGQAQLQNEELHFYHSISDCMLAEQVNIVLLSSVLSYLEKPEAILNELFRYGIPYILIDKTLFTEEGRDILCKQLVPESIYKASYPCRIMSSTKFITFMSQHYRLVKQYAPYHDADIMAGKHKARFKALFFEKLP